MPITALLAISLFLGGVPSPASPAERSTNRAAPTDAPIKIDQQAFQQIDESAGERLAARIAKAIDRLTTDRPVSIPLVWRLQEPAQYPTDVSATVYARTPELRLLLLPSAAALARHAPLPDPDARPADLADRTPRSSATIFFKPGSSDESAALWMPTPDGFPQPLPGVNLHAKPWRTTGRLVMSDPASSRRPRALSDGVKDTVARLGLRATNYLYTLPHNGVAVRVALCDADGKLMHAWHAFVIADAVSGRRPPEQTAPGESPYTVPFESETHDPRLGGYQLLRIPFANAYRGGGSVPGERITIDDALAAECPGYVALVTQPRSAPATPAYALVTDLNRIRTAAAENRIERLAIFETIDDDALEAVLSAVLKPE